jgi:hypothetical protein
LESDSRGSAGKTYIHVHSPIFPFTYTPCIFTYVNLYSLPRILRVYTLTFTYIPLDIHVISLPRILPVYTLTFTYIPLHVYSPGYSRIFTYNPFHLYSLYIHVHSRILFPYIPFHGHTLYIYVYYLITCIYLTVLNVNDVNRDRLFLLSTARR